MPRIIKISHKQIFRELLPSMCREIQAHFKRIPNGQILRLFPVPRGGVPVAYAVRSYLPYIEVVDSPDEADAIIDDLVDSGKTRARYKEEYPDLPMFVLLTKRNVEWIQFPWDESDGTAGADDIPRRLLQYIGEDPDRGGLVETPKRFLKAWSFWTQGYKQDPADILKVFEDGAESCDEMVLVRDIPVYSQCEHHLAPFFGKAHVAYIPSGKIVGLSKLSRLVDVFARRLQVQERLTNQVADALEQHLDPLGVGVVLECQHMCMESRGIQRSGAITTTSAMRGAMRDKPEARAELLRLIR